MHFVDRYTYVTRHAVRRGACALRLLVVAGCFFVAVPAAFAQTYQTDEIDDRARRNRAIAQQCCRNPSSYGANQEAFRDFFTKYYFPAMTRTSPQELASLGKMGDDLFGQFLWRTKSEPLQADLTSLTFDAMLRIIKKNNPRYHPAVRYNAILILGTLDEQYAIETGADRRPPKPLPKATKFLTQVAGASGRVHPSLVVGALIGLERHAKYHASLEPAAVADMTTTALKLILQKEPPPDVDDPVFQWMKRLAASILVGPGSASPQVHDGLFQLIGNQELTLDSRCQIVAQLARLDYSNAKVDGETAGGQLVQLVARVVQEEATKAKAFEDAQFGSRRGRGNSRRRGNFGKPEAYERRRIMTQVTNLLAGLRAIQPIVPEGRKEVLNRVVSSLKAIQAVAKDQSLIDLDVVKDIRQHAGEVKAAASEWGNQGKEIAAPADEKEAAEDLF